MQGTSVQRRPTFKLLPPANEVCEGYVFTGVCLSTQGGHVWLLPGGVCGCLGVCGCSWGGCAWLLPGVLGACMVALGGHAWLLPGGHTWLLWGGVVAPGGMHGCSGGACMVAPGGGERAWHTTRYGDTINERAVRILMECILVKQ